VSCLSVVLTEYATVEYAWAMEVAMAPKDHQVTRPQKQGTRTLRVEGVPLEHVRILKQKAAAVDSNMAAVIREMIVKAVEG